MISFNFYTFREQRLGDVLNISHVDKMYLIAENRDQNEFELIKIDEETINKLERFLNQYQVKVTTKHGWISNDETERFELYFEYNDQEIRRYTIEREIVVSDRAYEVVNAPINYQRIVEFEKELNLINDQERE